MVFNFSKNDPTTKRALKTKLVFKSFGRLSEINSVSESFCRKILDLWIATCNTLVTSRLES